MGRGGWQGTYHFNNGVDNGQHTSINNLSKSELSMIKNLPVITIVRNPYSLIISFFEDIIKKNNQTITLKEYLKSVKDRTLKANKSGKFTDVALFAISSFVG